MSVLAYCLALDAAAFSPNNLPTGAATIETELLELWDDEPETLAQALQRLGVAEPYAGVEDEPAELLDELISLLLSEGLADEPIGLEPCNEGLAVGLLFDLANSADETAPEHEALLSAVALGRRLGETTANEECGYVVLSVAETATLASVLEAAVRGSALDPATAEPLREELLGPLQDIVAQGKAFAISFH